MKHLKLTLLLVSAFAFSASYAQTAEEIVTKHIEAIGGIDAWRKVTSIRQEGTMQVQGAEVTVVRTVLHQKGSRQDISLAGMNGFSIVTPSAGWNFMPFQGQTQPEPLTEEDIKEGQSELDAQDELIDYKEKGSTVELVGKDDVDGTECFKLLVTFKSGKTESLFIDPKSFHIIRQVAKQKANGQEMEVITNFSNYQKLPEGIVVAMSITLPFGELNVTKVEVNKPVDETIFKPSK
jgi:outer membrane lipoprotein-sorting protein